MNDQACIAFLQWALEQLSMRWPGFRKVRGQVCKRIGSRLGELRLPDLKEYRMYLEENPLEWHILDSMCRITISRFYRDKGVYDSLRSQVFPQLIAAARQQGEKIISCWSIGAASGEEPYSVSLLWEFSAIDRRGLKLSILATEADQAMIKRARNGCYPASSVRELDELMQLKAFQQQDNQFCLQERYKKRVRFLQQDIRNTQPDDTFHLILCRNLIFTYFSQELQEELGREIVQRLKPGGCLILGIHEKLPDSLADLLARLPGQKIFRRKAAFNPA